VKPHTSTRMKNLLNKNLLIGAALGAVAGMILVWKIDAIHALSLKLANALPGNKPITDGTAVATTAASVAAATGTAPTAPDSTNSGA